MKTLLVLPLMLLCLAGAAFAADQPASALTLTWQSLIDYGASALATALVGAIAYAAQRLFGIVMEKSHRDALHSALTTGASLLISLVAEMMASGLSLAEARQQATQLAVGYVKAAVPDAIKAFKLGDQDDHVVDMLKAKEVQIKFGASPAMMVTAPALDAAAFEKLRSSIVGLGAPVTPTAA